MLEFYRKFRLRAEKIYTFDLNEAGKTPTSTEKGWIFETKSLETPCTVVLLNSGFQ